MPIVLTYEIESATPDQHNRVQSFFERLGWENLGGSSYRYPRLGSKQATEDWFNHVVPALMLFRCFIIDSELKLKKFTLDSQSSTGCNPQSANGYGHPPLPFTSEDFIKYTPSLGAFGKKNLRDWLAGVRYPY